MRKIRKQETWDNIEGKLMEISIERHGGYNPRAALMIAILVSAGRDKDFKFIEDEIFRALCIGAYLHPGFTKNIINLTIDFLDGKIKADFNEEEWDL